jgi:hypothetical protein
VVPEPATVLLPLAYEIAPERVVDQVEPSLQFPA